MGRPKNGGLEGNGDPNLRYWFCDPQKALSCAEPIGRDADALSGYIIIIIMFVYWRLSNATNTEQWHDIIA